MTSWRPFEWLRRFGAHAASSASRDRRVVEALVDAWGKADAAFPAELLRPDVVLAVDSGGASPVAPATVHGAEAAAQELRDLRDAFPRATLATREVNGAPGVVLRADGRVVGVVAVSVRGSAIEGMWAVVNPVKLEHWNRG
ncbi:hypothetical protein [Microbacterium ulmi]|uniref:RNA polymerase sigma-70 factor, ECF subfamily n=1 Tax=Microbacterium ulmi TaxID=179095 RepID=A0A7Y2M2K1_9MICO|nr:hypothetical protein [Microbacterium ulmi]NII68950.1 ketosteroid isomerase-like protein [Microbacterium ulmi]NNH03933.1 hypothetical protein [Microbacterium ulmi]